MENLGPRSPPIALTTDSSLLTAIANDFGIEGIFAARWSRSATPATC